MAIETIKKYHGQVRLCTCDTYRHPEKLGERACHFCYGHGFVAECTACDGKGSIDVPVNGGDASLGVMSSTCIKCGSNGCYGVKKPADWVDEPQKETVAA